MVTTTALCDRNHTPLWKSSFFAAAFQFGTADFPPSARIIVATLLFFALGNHGRNFQVLTSAVHGHKSQIGRRYMLRSIGNVILDKDFHSNFHGSMEDAVDGRS